MASPTPNRGMTYAGHGGAVNAWDAFLNANFDNIDQAFNTYPITIVATAAGATYNSSGAVISSTVATVTLPTSNTLNFHFPITGILTQNLTVVWSSVGDYYDVGNLTTGAFSLTATVSGSTTGGVTLPQGGRSFLVSDGSNGANGMYFGTSAFGDITVNSVTSVSTATALDFKATGTTQDVLPAGTAAQRPALSGGSTAVPVNQGGLRYNSDIKTTESSDGNYWRPMAIAQPIAGGFRNLILSSSAAASPGTQMVLTAAAGTVESTAPVAYRSSALSMTISSSFVGAGGLDAGALANNTFYSAWLIYSSTGNVYSGLFSASFTTPTMPAGYDCKARAGANITDTSTFAGAANLKKILQSGRQAQYVVAPATNTVAAPQMASGAAGNVGIPTWVTVSTSNFVPPTAAEIFIITQTAVTNSLILAPNANYGSQTSTTNPPYFGINTTNFAVPATISVSMLLETTSVQWACTSGSLSCTGWSDTI